MAEHYRDNPDVIGWQTDNELNTSMPESYLAVDAEGIPGAISRTDTARSTSSTSPGAAISGRRPMTISVRSCFPLDFAPTFPSPGHLQDYHRFLAFSTARFQHDQVEILRATKADWFIFHNLGGLRDIDFRGQFSTDLDFVGYDIYPMLYDEFQRIGNHAKVQALHLDICRGFSGNYIVPEQQSGFGSQPGFCTLTPEPGEMRRMAMSSVARGADGLMFFRWRPAHFGAEIYWMGIIDHDDVPRHRYDEAKQFRDRDDGAEGQDPRHLCAHGCRHRRCRLRQSGSPQDLSRSACRARRTMRCCCINIATTAASPAASSIRKTICRG